MSSASSRRTNVRGANHKAEALLVAHRTQDPRRIIHKAEAVQHTHDALIQIVQAAVEVEQFAPAIRVETERQRVDRKISPMQIQFDAAALNRRQHRRRRVELGAGGNEVEIGRQ